MCKVQMLRALVKQRLTAAEFEQFERTISEYEEEVCRLREDNERLQKLLDAVFKPELRLHRADDQQLLEVKEEQQDPEPPHIKEEPEELCISQDAAQVQELEEDVIKFTFTPVTVKSEEEDEERPQSSQLHQRQTEQMEPEAEDATSISFQYIADLNCACHACGKRFNNKTNLKVHMLIHTLEKPFGCTSCTKRFSVKSKLISHMALHETEKPFSCSACMRRFGHSGELRRHMRSHAGAFVKPGAVSMMKVYVRQKFPKIF